MYLIPNFPKCSKVCLLSYSLITASSSYELFTETIPRLHIGKKGHEEQSCNSLRIRNVFTSIQRQYLKSFLILPRIFGHSLTSFSLPIRLKRFMLKFYTDSIYQSVIFGISLSVLKLFHYMFFGVLCYYFFEPFYLYSFSCMCVMFVYVLLLFLISNTTCTVVS